MLPYKRSERVKKILHHKICDILKEIKDTRIGFVTITDTELSNDLKELKIYYSVLGDKKEQNDTKLVLNNAVRFFRSRIAEETTLRNVPNIEFVFDESVQRAQRIFSILDKVSTENKNLDDK